jgi:CRP-like cAMP-binding protein
VFVRLGKSNYVGEMAMLHDIKRTCSVVAHTFLLLLVLKKADFQQIISEDEDLKEEMMFEE